jgi:polar amino acid transport system substrate-binding protein
MQSSSDGRLLLWSVRLARLLIVVAAIAATPTRAQQSAPTADAARARLPADVRDKGVLVAAMPLDFEPFNYLNSENLPVGLDVDIFNAIANVLGLKPQVQRIGFASIIPSVRGGRVDVGMSAMGILKPRLTQVSFVRYGHFSNGLIVRAGNPSGITDTDGCGHTIALEKGTQPLLLWQDIAMKCEADGKPKINIMVFDGEGPQVLAVEDGRADAAGVGYATAVVAAEHSGGKLAAAPGGPVPGGTVESGIAFSMDRPALGAAIEAALRVLVANGTYDQIFAKWRLSVERATPAVITK